MKYQLLLLASFIIILISCNDDSTTSISGTVKSIETGQKLENAFIIQNNELLAKTNSEGEFNVISIDPGTYKIKCSALGFNDTISELVVAKGEISEIEFNLNSNAETGTIVGELQDKKIFEENVTSDPSLAEWSDQEIIDGITGATLMRRDLPENTNSEIYIGDSLITPVDDYGQYWVEIQTGTYPLTVQTEGYKSATKMVEIKTDTLLFINFFLSESD